MKQRIFSILAFLILFIGIFIYLNKLFTSSNHYNNTFEDFTELASKTNIDLIFYGSSHSYTAYNPLIFNNECNIISFNLGSPSLRLPFNDLILEASLKKTNPKLIVLEVFKGTLSNKKLIKKDKGYQLQALDHVPFFSYNKHKKVARIYDFNEYLGVMFPLIRNHKEWNIKLNSPTNFSRSYKFNEYIYYTNGYVGYETIINDSLQRKTYENFKNQKKIRDTSIPLLNEETKKYLKDFINIANKKNIPVLVVTTPDLWTTSQNYYLFDEVRLFLDELNVPYLNLNNYTKEIDLTIDDFMDPGHLNLYGGTKVSKFLSEYINKHYSFTDRSDENLWKEIDKTYDESKGRFSHSDSIYHYSLDSVNKNLTENILIRNIKIEKNNTNYRVKINIDKTINYKEDFNKYNLSFNIYSQNESKKRKKTDIRLIDKESTIIIDFNSSITNIKMIEIFVYNKEGYTGAIGNRILINELISFDN